MEIIFKERNSGKTSEIRQQIIETNLRFRDFNFGYIGLNENLVKDFKQRILNLIPIGTGFNRHLPFFMSHKNSMRGLMGRHLSVLYIDDISLEMIRNLHLFQSSARKLIMRGSIENLISEINILYDSSNYFSHEIKERDETIQILSTRLEEERNYRRKIDYENYELRNLINNLKTENKFLKIKTSIFLKLKKLKNKIIKILRR